MGYNGYCDIYILLEKIEADEFDLKVFECEEATVEDVEEALKLINSGSTINHTTFYNSGEDERMRRHWKIYDICSIILEKSNKVINVSCPDTFARDSERIIEVLEPENLLGRGIKVTRA